ncbi:MAG: 8-amino-7-oxononanoate synthase [Cyanobacteriota bacterium ELA615]
MAKAYSWLEKSLETIEKAGWYRTVKTIGNIEPPFIELEGLNVINFASNDYLGLAADSRLKVAAIKAIEQYGTGATGSRLLTGHRQLHRNLEKSIAQLKGSQDALVFSSGYLANLGTIAALVNNRDLILSDQYNHSSLKNGAKLSQATLQEYPHNDYQTLEKLLKEQRALYRRCLIISDGVFSMDGDLGNLPQLITLAQNFDTMLLIDDAHASGVLGQTGAGSLEHWGISSGEIIQTGTFSKALGSLGGYVAGSTILIDYLRNRAASWIYTTGLSPADTAAALEALVILKTQPQFVQKIQANINYFAELLGTRAQSAIFPILLKDPQQASQLANNLLKNGIFAPAIRPPTVPTSRLRISLMAKHNKEHLDYLYEFLSRYR